MVTVLEGTGKFTIGGDVFILKEGETIIMPKDVPHAVYGQEKFKIAIVFKLWQVIRVYTVF
jgi:quercetin dioxygenase-like cupin family protein